MKKMKEKGARIRTVRKRLGLTQEEFAARLANVSRGAVGNWEIGKGIKTENLIAMANEFGVEVAWLVNGGEEEPRIKKAEQSATSLASLPVRGTAQAGVWFDDETHDFGWEFLPCAPDIRFPTSEQFFMRVRGDSMDASMPPISDGAMVKCVSISAWGKDIRDGLLVVAKNSRDSGRLVQTTIRRARVTSAGIELLSESTNPKHKPIKVRLDSVEEPENEVSIVGIVLQVIFDAGA